MRKIIEAYRQFPIWFQKTQWKNIQFVEYIDWKGYPNLSNPLLFQMKFLGRPIRVIFDFDRFDSIYRKNNEDIDATYWKVSEILKDQFWAEVQKIFKNEVGELIYYE